MSSEHITIDGLAFDKRLCKDFSFNGVFSGQTLAGIELTLSNLGPRDQETIKELRDKASVKVEDPFSQRRYEATVFQKSNSFTVGQDVQSYVLEIREKDSLPPFDEIDLNGNRFKVDQYEEYLTEGKIARKAVLRLNQDEFETVRNLLCEKTVQFQRIGVDDEPFELRFGGGMYWSTHEEDNQKYFKHIVRLFPVELASSKLNLASGTTQSVVVSMLIELQAKFDLLLKHLGEENHISKEMQTALLGSDWKDISDKTLISSLQDQFEQVNDADEYF